MNKSIRESRLRPEFAALYPYLHAGTWAPAARMAAAIVERIAQTGLPPGADLDARIMSDDRFEFRGGDPEARERLVAGQMTFRDCLALRGGSGAAPEGAGDAHWRQAPPSDPPPVYAAARSAVPSAGTTARRERPP